MMTLRPVEVFFSYSHKDEIFRDQLEDHLSMLKRQGLIKPWHDRKITPGDEWQGEIDANLASADLILLLITSNFLASDYCYDIEMKQAMKRHQSGEAQIIPIILTPVEGWQYSPFSKLQVLPKDGKPVSRWADPNEAFVDIAKGIRRAIHPYIPDLVSFSELEKPSLSTKKKSPNASATPDLPPDEWSRQTKRTLAGRVFDFLFEDR